MLPCSQFVADGVFYAELNELLTRELAEDGYSGVEVRVTPMRTEIIIRATRTQSVLGKMKADVLSRPPGGEGPGSGACRGLSKEPAAEQRGGSACQRGSACGRSCGCSAEGAAALGGC